MASTSSASSGKLQNYLKLAEAALRAGDQTRAMLIAEEASAAGLDHPNLLAMAVYQVLAVGDAGKALSYAERARKLAPNSIDVLQAAAVALANNDRQREALAVYDKALRQQPSLVALRYNRGRLLEDMGESVRARSDYERVVEMMPNHATALARLAAIAVANNESAIARGYADRALKFNPRETAAVIVLAQADLLDKKYDAVIARMTPLVAAEPNAVNRSLAQGLIADALDAQGRKNEAFAAYRASNELLRTEFAPLFGSANGETALARAERTLAHVKAAQSVTSMPTESPVKTHVFLLGFPRSGTTLLENVLAGHPDVETVEERDGLLAAEMDFIVPPDGLERLETAQDFARYREAYWAEMETAGASLEKPVFVDKMPLNSLLLPLIAKLFPQAKVLLAVRDPRDVVLSCFRRRFGMSEKMYELLSLDRAAALYDVAMQLGEVARAKYPMPFCITRYEDLVSGFETEARALCEFLGVEYTDAMAGFADRAREKLINTPSAAQVAEGLYTRGVDQWRAYANQIASAMPALAPWIKKFGYAEE
jgi:tetratricopeptide (TPR) repeat protein